MKIIQVTQLLSMVLLSLAMGRSEAAVIKVPSEDILTIQQGVDAAGPADTVLVMPGTYTNPDAGQWWPPVVHVSEAKAGLKLKAAGGPGSVRITGPGFGFGIFIGADEVSVEGFQIAGFDSGIIAVGAANDGGRITRNIINNCARDCVTIVGSTGYEIDHNLFDGGDNGLFLNGWPGAGPNTRHHVHHNVVSNSGEGIFLWLSSDCVIEQNEITNSGATGIYLASSPRGAVHQNQVNDGQSVGIAIAGSPDSQVSGNTANNNGIWGIAVTGSCGVHFSHNSAEGNGQFDLFAPDWDGAVATCNTYSKNHAGTAFPSLSLWDAE